MIRYMKCNRSISLFAVTIFLVFSFQAFASDGFVNDEIEATWERIQEARELKSGSPDELQPPATNKMVDQLAKDLELVVPQQLRESLLTHNGMDKWGLEIIDEQDSGQALKLLGIDQIRQHWQEDRKSEAEAIAEGDDYPKKSDWIPIFIDPAECEDQIYIDSKDGSVLLFQMPASVSVHSFRYPDLNTFLMVLEHHIRNELWFDWGNGLDQKAIVPPPMLNEQGIKKLVSLEKNSVVVLDKDQKEIAIEKNSDAFLNSVLNSFKPVKLTRTPGVQNPDYTIDFNIGPDSHRVVVMFGPDENLSYSIGSFQFIGGRSAEFRKLIESIRE